MTFNDQFTQGIIKNLIYPRQLVEPTLFQTFKFLPEQPFQKIGDGMICEGWQSNDMYTFDSQRHCNGWKGVTLRECEARCTQNEVPINCQQQGIKCKYVQFNTADNSCHLGDFRCKPVKGDAKYTLTMKPKEKSGMFAKTWPSDFFSVYPAEEIIKFPFFYIHIK